MFNLANETSSRHLLSLDLALVADGFTLRFTNVYAPCDRAEKTLFLESLATHEPDGDTPWIIVGDFNLTRDPSDRNNDNFSVNDATMFNDSINNLYLIELPLTDRSYTWSNRRNNPTLARLDHVFINHASNATFPSSTLSSLTHDTSDHVPLIATISTLIPKRGHFRYDASWGLHDGFKHLICSTWARTTRHDPTTQIAARLRQCRFHCKAWAKRSSPTLFRENDCRILISLLDLLE
jgi:hypothetical protein